MDSEEALSRQLSVERRRLTADCFFNGERIIPHYEDEHEVQLSVPPSDHAARGAL